MAVARNNADTLFVYPRDVTHAICVFLGINALGRLCTVSHRAYQAVRRDQALWRDRLAIHYPKAWRQLQQQRRSSAIPTATGQRKQDAKESSGLWNYYDEFRRALIEGPSRYLR